EVSFFFQAEDGIRDRNVTGVQTCALPIFDQSVAVHVLFRFRRLPGGKRLTRNPGASGAWYGYGAPHRRNAPPRGDARRGRRAGEIGRASCRERVWWSVGAGAVERRAVAGG